MINRKEVEIDITRNLKMIEWLKSQLLQEVALLFKNMLQGAKEEAREAIGDAVSSIMITGYLLAKRLGITYQVIDLKMSKKIKLGITQEHDMEKYYGDLSELSRHLDSKGR
jgi:hypothetical protein